MIYKMEIVSLDFSELMRLITDKLVTMGPDINTYDWFNLQETICAVGLSEVEDFKTHKVELAPSKTVYDIIMDSEHTHIWETEIDVLINYFKTKLSKAELWEIKLLRTGAIITFREELL